MTWPQDHHKKLPISDFVHEFEALADQEDPFVYPIVHVRPD